MCLAIPGRVVEVLDDANRLALIEVGGVKRSVNVGLLDGDGGGPGVQAGEWVLIHVGFALSKIDQREALATLELLQQMGADYEQELRELQGERDRMMAPEQRSTDASRSIDHPAGCLTCGDAATWMRVADADSARELAVCLDDGERVHTVDTGIVGAVAPGDRLLVHAGAALLKESA